MGSGKSTIGLLLAKKMHLDFYDSDKVIAERTGVDIPRIFDVEGEKGFRDREIRIIEELVQLPNIVLATGGGAVTQKQSRDALQKNGIVVYLETSIQQQLQRVRGDKNRPLLQTENPESRLRELLEQRDPLYREIADFIVRTDKQHPKSMAATIIKTINA